MPRFDLPIYCAAWAEPAARDDEIEVVVLAGGGGNGIANKIFLSRYNWQTQQLSEELQSVSTGDDVPYRMTLHPGGEGSIVCSRSTNCTTLNLRYSTPKDGQLGWNLEPAEESVASLSGAGQQCIVFSADGSRLAAGGEDGHLRVFDWPSLQPLLDKAGAHLRIKDLDFRALLSVSADATARVSLLEDARWGDFKGYLAFVVFFLVSLLVSFLVYVFTRGDIVPRWKERIISLHHSN